MKINGIETAFLGMYSAIYGKYDRPKNISPEVRCSLRPVMYTDNEETANYAFDAGWIPKIVDHHFESPNGDPAIVVPMLNHKYWKCHPEEALPDVDVSIWIDGSIEPGPAMVDDFVTALGDDDWSCCPHPARSCIYPEAQFSATLTWRYDTESILRQARHYSMFHPSGWGLIATGVNIRRHTAEVIEVSHHWWDEILEWSHQDQLSLPVLLRLYEGKVKWNMNLGWFRNWFLHPHG